LLTQGTGQVVPCKSKGGVIYNSTFNSQETAKKTPTFFSSVGFLY